MQHIYIRVMPPSTGGRLCWRHALRLLSSLRIHRLAKLKLMSGELQAVRIELPLLETLWYLELENFEKVGCRLWLLVFFSRPTLFLRSIRPVLFIRLLILYLRVLLRIFELSSVGDAVDLV